MGRNKVSRAHGAVLLGVFCLVGTAATYSGAAGGRGPYYSQREVAHCLTRNGVSQESELPFTVRIPAYQKLFPAGITGVISVPAPATSSGRFDHVLLYFFRSGQFAKAGEARLVSTYYYARGVPTAVALLLHIHGVASPAEIEKLTRVTNNLVVLWEYPRHHAAASDKLLNACLEASHS
jgi:hypothetical protein